jgi:hypothetical protein
LQSRGGGRVVSGALTAIAGAMTVTSSFLLLSVPVDQW